ncbi:MAG: DedA family protein, partial [Anaerolineales bacterium]
MQPDTSQLPKEKTPLKQTVSRVASLVFVIAITIAILYLPEEQVQRFEQWGYLGIFLLSILANATVIIPAPGLIFVFSMAARFDPLWVGIAAGLGATLGELSGYLAGYSGQAVIENQKHYDQLTSWMERNGPLTVAILAFIPNPLFDLAGMIAGILKMPVARFLLFVMVGKIPK